MAEDKFHELVEFLRSGDGRELEHTDLEALLKERGRELLRELFQAQVDSRGPGLAAQPVVGADGLERGQVRLHERGLSTVFGSTRLVM